MDGPDPRRHNLPAEFPIFPLPGALLLPRGRLPLNIFEPRYLAMIEDALGESRCIGMIQPDETQAPGANGPALYHIGCLGKLVSFSETEDGRFLVTLAGIARFDVAEETAPRRGYRRVRANFGRFTSDLLPASSSLTDRPGLLAALRAYFHVRGFEANWEAIETMADDTLAVTLAMVCPFEPVEKQALLEAPTPEEREAALRALLQMGAHDDPDGSPASPS